MNTPAEIAQQVQQLDDEQWYDFLDRLDEIARQRRQRASDQPVDGTRDDAGRRFLSLTDRLFTIADNFL